MTVRARTGAEQAACPACGTLSSRIHSRYVRRLADSAVGSRRVLIELQVRRFRCRERACRQATFAEQVDGLTFPRVPQSMGTREPCGPATCWDTPGRRVPTSPSSGCDLGDRVQFALPDSPSGSTGSDGSSGLLTNRHIASCDSLLRNPPRHPHVGMRDRRRRRRSATRGTAYAHQLSNSGFRHWGEVRVCRRYLNASR
ncbi:transposase family protein [Streptomyces sp. NBC_01017]|uniref:transposase family protein n=1 Tax=Streptomyces sp. NBC_01017 TaxID=2903721 RepID=UPI0038638C6C